jgi:hypothetical protein
LAQGRELEKGGLLGEVGEVRGKKGLKRCEAHFKEEGFLRMQHQPVEDCEGFNRVGPGAATTRKIRIGTGRRAGKEKDKKVCQ